MRSHYDVIQAFGGLPALARAIGVDPQMAVHWPKRGIPPKYWPDIEVSALGARMGITARLLRHIPRRPPATDDAPPPPTPVECAA